MVSSDEVYAWNGPIQRNDKIITIESSYIYFSPISEKYVQF